LKININLISEKPYQINEMVTFNEEYYKNSMIKSTRDIKSLGKIYLNSAEEIILEINLQGVIKIIDSYSAELVDYPININFEENFGEISQIEENTLDILDILWENIVLEVPISFTTKKSIQTAQGEGWELLDEDAKKIDPRLAKLSELLTKGEE